MEGVEGTHVHGKSGFGARDDGIIHGRKIQHCQQLRKLAAFGRGLVVVQKAKEAGAVDRAMGLDHDDL
jgi:hypothetical protein